MQVELQRQLGNGGESVAVFAARRTQSHELLPTAFAVKVVSSLNFRVRYLQMLKELTILAQLSKVGGIWSSLHSTSEKRGTYMP